MKVKKLNQIMKIPLLLGLFFSLPNMMLVAQNDSTKEGTEGISTTSFNFCKDDINFLDSDEDVTDIVAPAPWSFLFTLADPDPIVIDTDFNKNSIDRFFIEVEKEGIVGNEITGELTSLVGPMEVDKIGSMRMTRQGTTNKFRSVPIIVVTDIDEVDDNFGIDDCSNTTAEWDDVDDIDIDPTIYAIIGGTLKASYDGNEKSINICDGAMKTVIVNAYIMQSGGIPYTNQNLVKSQLDKAIELMGMACLRINYTIQLIEVDGDVDLSNGLFVPDIDIESDEMKDLIQPIKDLGNDEEEIDMIFLNYFTGNNDRGIALRDEIAVAPAYEPSHKRTIIIASDNANLFTSAHEIGHILTNKGHYQVDYDTSDQFEFKFYNLMKEGTASCNGVYETKRLKSSQINWLRLNTNIPQ